MQRSQAQADPGSRSGYPLCLGAGTLYSRQVVSKQCFKHTIGTRDTNPRQNKALAYADPHGQVVVSRRLEQYCGQRLRRHESVWRLVRGICRARNLLRRDASPAGKLQAAAGPQGL